jgi:hypothetical protein
MRKLLIGEQHHPVTAIDSPTSEPQALDDSARPEAGCGRCSLYLTAT